MESIDRCKILVFIVCFLRGHLTRLQSLTQLLKLFPLTLLKRLVEFGDGKKLDRLTKIQKKSYSTSKDVRVINKAWWQLTFTEDWSEIFNHRFGREHVVSCACRLLKVIFIYEALRKFEWYQNYPLLISGTKWNFLMSVPVIVTLSKLKLSGL